MEHNNAKELLKKTFEQEFNIDRFASFISELFNHFNRSIHDVPVRKEYYDYVDTVNSLGVYRDPDKRSIEVFAIQLKRTSSRDRARTMQRNLIARYLTNFNRDAALVAFYGDDPEDWRFSFVKMEYELTKDEKGSLKVTQELTPAMRYSFLVGKNEPNHTCKTQFLGLIKEENIDPSLSQIEEKFSIEKVTKVFFDEYKELYLKLKESLEKSIQNDEIILQEFENKVIKTSDFAKKLMGQIVFIYFLQKKGWLGVKKGKKWGTGPKKFLRKLFEGEIVKYDNFFNDILEHLFYDALASKSEGDYYDLFECRIPFLNGGLFEPINDYDWKKTDIILKNEIFKKIIDTFDQYNFTVKEDEPLEKEVAVDPEMLGKVFENLLEIEDRKSKGAFYTPREIVHYMCQESLINYLDTNSEVAKDDIKKFICLGDVALGSIIKQQEEFKKYQRTYGKSVLPDSIKKNHEKLDKLLSEIKVVDPAVGSGAFPVGMMNEIIRARTILSLYSEKTVTNYELKLKTIENCLYGVDIDSSAVDITKLRFWLSLIVDEEDVVKIDPLPNLDHKIMCGNSLLEEFEGKKLFDENLLFKAPKDYSEQIKEIQNEIDDLHRELGEIFTGKIQDDNKKDEIKDEIKKLQNKKKRLQKPYEDDTNQFTLDENFNQIVKESQLKLNDLKRLQKLFFKEQNAELKKKYKEKIDEIEWDFIEKALVEENSEHSIKMLENYKNNQSKPFFIWKLYFADVFQRTNQGFDIVIANPPYVRYQNINERYPNQREILKKSSCYETLYDKWDLYVAFLEKGLKLLRTGGTLTFIISNSFNTSRFANAPKKFIIDNYHLKKIDFFKNISVFKGVGVENVILHIINQNSKEDSKRILHTNSFDQIKSLQPSKEIDKIFRITEEIDFKSKFKNTTLLENICYISIGMVLNSKNGEFKKDDLISDFKTQTNTKEYIEAKNIERYYVKKIRFLEWESKRCPSKISRPTFPELYENSKIIRGTTNEGFFDESGLLCNHSAFVFVLFESIKNVYNRSIQNYIRKLPKTRKELEINSLNFDLLYILAILNSKFAKFYLNSIRRHRIEYYFYSEDFKQLPIKKISLEEQQHFIEKVKTIMECKKAGDISESEKIDQEIDQMIYKLYGLTNDEIKKVEDSFLGG